MKEKCGIYGIYSIKDNISIDNLLKGLNMLQHRGQDGCGISYVNKNNNLTSSIRFGLVDDAFDDFDSSIKTRICIGHVRYSTSSKSENNDKSNDLDECQPIKGNTFSEEFYLAHNGNIPNIKGHDTKHIVNYLEQIKGTWEEKLTNLINSIPSAYCLLILTKDRLFALRDRFGIRPLCIGYNNNSFCISSESYALHDHQFLCDINPGEIISFDKKGINKVYTFPNPELRICALEYIYFMKPESFCDNLYVKDVRYKMGVLLAQNEQFNFSNKKNINAVKSINSINNSINNSKKYVVVGVPETGIISAKGYANELNIKYKQIINKNKKSNRTFILPDNKTRINACNEKFNFNEENIKGANIIVIDDSIVRGNVIKSIINKLWLIGANEIHIRVSSPPVISTCQFGIDIPSKTELLVYRKSYTEIIKELNVTSIRYFKYKDLEKVLPPNCYKECFGEKLDDYMFWDKQDKDKKEDNFVSISY